MGRVALLALVLATLLPAPRLIAQTEPLPAGQPPLFGLSAGYGFTLHLNRTLPYISIGGGLGWTDLKIEEIDHRFNFLLQGSAGVRRALSETEALTLEARLAQISNGGTKRPNLGLNCLVFLAGWRFR